jgi:alkyl hydroperoxide reductase subunit AhpF
MSYLQDRDEKTLSQRLMALPTAVELVVEGSADHPIVIETLDLVSYLVSLSPHTLSYVYQSGSPAPKVWLRSKAVRLLDIVFWGVPTGLEFTALVDAIALYSGITPQLDVTTRSLLDQIYDSIAASIFVSPT